MDRFQLAYSFINSERSIKSGFSVRQCLKMFGVSRTGYYSWLDRKRDRDGKRKAKEEDLNLLMEKFREIIKKLGFVPGKRTFRTHLWRDHQICLSLKKCRSIMAVMHLTANKPKKDAYKHQATHDHVCASPENKVLREFYVGPRKVILTDITYLYYGASRKPIYLCAFKDACTKEILGRSTGLTMDTAFVKRAYDNMMEKHGDELKNPDVYVHHDQGSQYLSTDFKSLLSDDGFIQSVSARGNSLDNAPMESFFGRMKCELLNIMALCPNASAAKDLIEGYIDSYNDKRYQYSLAGLTPSEYYLYLKTGIYPLDNYFGVSSSDLLPIENLIKARLEAAKELAAKRRAKYLRNRIDTLVLKTSPEKTVIRDIELLLRELSKWKKTDELAKKQIPFLEEVIKKARKAISFLKKASNDILNELKIPQNWQKYPELAYVYEMDGLF